MRIALTRCYLLLFLALSGLAAQAQNAYCANFGLGRFIEANHPITIAVWARNASSTPYYSCSVSWKLDAGSAHNMTSISIGSPGVIMGNYMPVTSPATMSAPEGAHVLRVWVNTSFDTDHSNDTLVIPFTALTQFAPKVVLLEARTETWCPNCPLSNDLTNELMLVPEYAVAKFHLSDEFDFPDGDTYYGQYNVNYTPAGIIDMGDYNSYGVNSQYGGWEAAMQSRAQGVSPLVLQMASSLDWTTRVLTVTLDATFTYALSGGEFKMNIYALENLVPGAQENAPSGYIHNRLMRAMLGGASGTTGVIPAAPVVGTTYSHTFTWTVPAGIKLGDLKLIGLVEQNLGTGGRDCINTVKSGASPVGMNEETLAADRLVVFPNPFQQDLSVVITGLSGKARAELVSMDGRLVETRAVILNGSVPTRLDVGAGLPAGAYVLRMITDGGTIERTVMKVD